jgi:hypothetical protein
MAAALQCPDCGHQEMLDHLGGVTTFRCGGCGRALKVPSQFRDGARASGPGSRPPGPGDATQAMPRVAPPMATPPVGAPPFVGAATVGSVGSAGLGVAPVPGGLANPGVPTGRVPATAGAGGSGIDGIDGPAGDAAGDGAPGPIAPESLKPPLILRLLLWVIALPLGSLIVFGLASAVHVLTKSQLEDTFLRADWGRFVPIARLLPFCALATALLVQLGVFGLELLHARNVRGRRAGGASGRGSGGGSRPGPGRPHAPRGPGQRATNGRTLRDRVTS